MNNRTVTKLIGTSLAVFFIVGVAFATIDSLGHYVNQAATAAVVPSWAVSIITAIMGLFGGSSGFKALVAWLQKRPSVYQYIDGKLTADSVSRAFQWVDKTAHLYNATPKSPEAQRLLRDQVIADLLKSGGMYSEVAHELLQKVKNAE
jgi:hypothetical protein